MTDDILITPQAAILPGDEVSSTALSRVLDAAFIENEIDEDGDIYVAEGLEIPVWIHVDRARKRIVFVTRHRVEADLANWLERVNRMNGTIAVPQFVYRGGAVWGTYWLSCDGGLNVRQFVMMLRTFAGAFATGFQLFEGEASTGPC